jgi:GT2 family glycosyltransferase
MTREVTVLIPNWNGARVLAAALASVARQSVRAERVMVVDNGSVDGSLAIASEYGAEVVRLESNGGFSRAVNEGICRCETEWLAIVNNDVELEPDWLERLLERQSARHWFLAPRVLRHDDPTQLDGSFDLVSRAACAWRAGHGRPDSQEWRSEEEIAFPSFTAGLFRRELFDRVGLLEEKFVSYLEDVDFGFRCSLSGHRGLYVPAAAVRHRGSATLGAWSPEMVRLVSRNQVLLVARHYPDGWMERYGAAVLTGQLLWGLLALRRGVFGAWAKGKVEGISAYREARGPVVAAPAAELDQLLRGSEKRILQLQRRDGFDWFWRAYFRWNGEAVG